MGSVHTNKILSLIFSQKLYVHNSLSQLYALEVRRFRELDLQGLGSFDLLWLCKSMPSLLFVDLVPWNLQVRGKI